MKCEKMSSFPLEGTAGRLCSQLAGLGQVEELPGFSINDAVAVPESLAEMSKKKKVRGSSQRKPRGEGGRDAKSLSRHPSQLVS